MHPLLSALHQTFSTAAASTENDDPRLIALFGKLAGHVERRKSVFEIDPTEDVLATALILDFAARELTMAADATQGLDKMHIEVELSKVHKAKDRALNLLKSHNTTRKQFLNLKSELLALVLRAEEKKQQSPPSIQPTHNLSIQALAAVSGHSAFDEPIAKAVPAIPPPLSKPTALPPLPSPSSVVLTKQREEAILVASKIETLQTHVIELQRAAQTSLSVKNDELEAFRRRLLDMQRERDDFRAQCGVLRLQSSELTERRESELVEARLKLDKARSEMARTMEDELAKATHMFNLEREEFAQFKKDAEENVKGLSDRFNTHMAERQAYYERAMEAQRVDLQREMEHAVRTVESRVVQEMQMKTQHELDQAVRAAEEMAQDDLRLAMDESNRSWEERMQQELKKQGDEFQMELQHVHEQHVQQHNQFMHDAEFAKQAELNEQARRHEVAIAELTSQFQHMMDEMRIQHETEMTGKVDIVLGHNEEMQQLVLANDQQMKDMKAQLQTQYQQDLTEMQAKHQNAMDDMLKEHEQHMTRALEEREAHMNETLMEQGRAWEAYMAQAQSTLVQTYEENMTRLKNDLQSQLHAMEQQMSNRTSVQYETELSQLKSELANVELRVRHELMTKHQDDLAQLSAKYESQPSSSSAEEVALQWEAKLNNALEEQRVAWEAYVNDQVRETRNVAEMELAQITQARESELLQARQAERKLVEDAMTATIEGLLQSARAEERKFAQEQARTLLDAAATPAPAPSTTFDMSNVMDSAMEAQIRADEAQIWNTKMYEALEKQRVDWEAYRLESVREESNRARLEERQAWEAYVAEQLEMERATREELERKLASVTTQSHHQPLLPEDSTKLLRAVQREKMVFAKGLLRMKDKMDGGKHGNVVSDINVNGGDEIGPYSPGLIDRSFVVEDKAASMATSSVSDEAKELEALMFSEIPLS